MRAVLNTCVLFKTFVVHSSERVSLAEDNETAGVLESVAMDLSTASSDTDSEYFPSREASEKDDDDVSDYDSEGSDSWASSSDDDDDGSFSSRSANSASGVVDGEQQQSKQHTQPGKFKIISPATPLGVTTVRQIRRKTNQVMTNNKAFKHFAASCAFELTNASSGLNNCRAFQSVKQIPSGHLRKSTAIGVQVSRGGDSEDDCERRLVWKGNGKPFNPRKYYSLSEHTKKRQPHQGYCFLCNKKTLLSLRVLALLLHQQKK
jgi:hypothetical protein